MNIQLPGPVAGYLAAEKAKDTVRLAECFQLDAVVRDEGKEHRGVAAIKRWHREANEQYRFAVEPLDATVEGSTVVVRTRVTGDFPGGVAHLRCTFEIADDRIDSLEIAP